MPVRPDQVTGVIVTRGECDLAPCLVTWPDFADVMIWDNSHQPRDTACFGRWLASSQSTTGTVFFQDDDTIIPTATIEAMLEQYNEGDPMLCNMNRSWVHDFNDEEFSYTDLGLVGAGCLAPRDAWEPAAIQYLSHYPEDRFFHEWADFAIGILTPHTKVDLPYEIRDMARDANRLANVPGNRARRKAMMRRVRNLRDAHTPRYEVTYPATLDA